MRERIQINNEPLSEEDFAKYFFQTWDRFDDKTAKPTYFRFLTLMAFHTYMSEGVDTAIIECGIGGEYDSTNIIVSPTVTGITSLGIDHVAMLGETIEEIAWHKAGIMKPGAPAFTVPQPPTALEVLQQRAASKSVTLEVVQPDPSLRAVPLGLAGEFQVSNASLAVRVASAHLHALGLLPGPIPGTSSSSTLPAEFLRGLRQVRWPGRCETRHEKNIIWHIDSAHTLESIQAAATWFIESLASLTNANPSANPPSSTPPPNPNPKPKPPLILLFNQQTRDADAFARSLFRIISTALGDPHPFTHVVFCTNQTFPQTGSRPDLISHNNYSNSGASQTGGAGALQAPSLEVQTRLASTWQGMDPVAIVRVVVSIDEAVRWVRGVVNEGETVRRGVKKERRKVPVLVTGSVHLVGGFLEALETGGGERGNER